MKSSPKKKRPPVASARRASEPVPPAWRRHALLLGGLWILALATWSNSFSSGFVFDNRMLIQDPRVKAVTAENIGLIFGQEFRYPASVTGLYRPVTTLSFLFNYSVLGNGGDPAGWHWINFLLHAINIALVYALALLLLGEVQPALALAALWALHPVLTESVTNLIGRADLLSAFGVLAGLLCHVRAASDTGRRKAAWLAGLALAVAVGIFSKESAVVIVAVMLAYDLTFATTPWRARAAGYVAIAAPLAIYFSMRHDVLARAPALHIPFGDNPLVGADFWTSRITALKVMGEYLGLLLWPHNLSADYSYNQVPLFAWRFQTWEVCKAALALAILLTAALVAVRCFRSAKPIFFFLVFFAVTLAPVSNFFLLIGTIKAERFLYLPSVAFAGCVVFAVYACGRRLPASWPHARFAAPALLAAITLAFAVRTYSRNFDWRDERSLWTSGVRAAPASFKAHQALAAAVNDGSPAGLDQAIQEMDRTLAILAGLPDERNVPTPYVNAGSYYRQKGDLLAVKRTDGTFVSTPQSLPWYRKSIETLQHAERIANVMQAGARQEDLATGEDRQFGYSLYQLDAELGHTDLRLGDYPAALQAFRKGLSRHASPEFFVDIAGVWRATGDLHRAAVTLLEGLIVDASYTGFAPRLVQLYRQIDPQGCALQGAGPSVNLNLQCPMVHDDVCAAARNVEQSYRQANQPSAAAGARQTAVSQLGCPAQMFH